MSSESTHDPLRFARPERFRRGGRRRGRAGRHALNGLILDEDRTIGLECRQDIPIGHKVALKDMQLGDTVIKYGVDIGKVVAPIRKGEHAHVHNIKTKRW